MQSKASHGGAHSSGRTAAEAPEGSAQRVTFMPLRVAYTISGPVEGNTSR